MITSTKYCVLWAYRAGDEHVRRQLHSAKLEPCIEAARLMNGNPYVMDVQVLETDTGKSMDWQPERIGQVIYKTEA